MILVAAAIIENAEGAILIAKRRKGKAQEGLWEFPGGKLEEGETAEVCLIRELSEEMRIRIQPYEYFDANDHRYGETFIRLIAYKAKYLGGEITLSDHDEARWVSGEELREYEFAPADVPFVEKLLRMPGGSGSAIGGIGPVS